MGKVVMVISAAVTAFVLTITAGAAYAYRHQTASSAAAAAPAVQQPVAQPTAALQLVAAPAPAEIADVSPQDAASIAAKFLNRTDLYSVELADLQGAQTFKVTFSAGDIVFVSMKGLVLSSTPPPAPVVVSSTGGGGGGGHRNRGGGGGAGSAGGGGGGGESGEGEHEGGGD